MTAQVASQSSVRVRADATRSLAVDLVKALAMVGVIAQHSLTNLRAVGASLWIFQAVPVLVVLFGLNLRGSLYRRGSLGLHWYLRGYLPRRLERLLVPLGVAWVVAAVLGQLTGTLHIGALVVVGMLPVAGPGSYFVPMIIALTFVAPLIHAAYRRSVLTTVLVLVVLDLGFELVAPKIGILMSHNQFLYDASPLRYLVAFVTGFLILDGIGAGARRTGVVVLVVASLAYLLLETTHGEWFGWFIDKWTRPTNLFAVPYAAALTLLLMRVLPRTSSNRLLRMLAYAGRASFHVFLVQMLWFAFYPEHSSGAFVVALVLCFAIGIVFFWLESQVRVRMRSRPTAI